jgi:glyoxylase I family protein
MRETPRGENDFDPASITRGGSMTVLHFSHTGICVSDLERSTAFYRDALGFKQHHRLHFEGEPAATLLQIKDVELDAVYLERDGSVIELLYFPDRVESRDAIPREVNRLGLTHFSFNVDQIDQVCREIETAGGRVLESSRVGDVSGPNCIIFVTDPDGTLIELVQSPADPTRLPLQPDDLVR